MKEEKIAVILFNLGGPDRKDSIRPFLVNFFMDRNIIRAPYPVRFVLSRYIAGKRSKNQAGSAYAKLGYKSPLLENTQKQATALQQDLGRSYKTFVCMRYWHPMAEEIAAEVKQYNPDKIVLLPLYPQYSTTTTRSSFQDWNLAACNIGLKCPTSITCCYPLEDGFVSASADRIRKVYRDLLEKTELRPRILFSAHGLPEKIVKSGDPYQWQCEQTAQKIAEKLEIENPDWTVCYQSRVGPLKWIGPSTEEALQQAAQDKVPVLIYPHAFVSEHVETIVEIGEEYRHLAEKIGIPAFAAVETVGEHPDFIKGLAALVRSAVTSGKLLAHDRTCPMQFKQCCYDEMNDLGFCSR